MDVHFLAYLGENNGSRKILGYNIWIVPPSEDPSSIGLQSRLEGKIAVDIESPKERVKAVLPNHGLGLFSWPSQASLLKDVLNCCYRFAACFSNLRFH